MSEYGRLLVDTEYEGRIQQRILPVSGFYKQELEWIL